jgi:hypothetical protein
MLVLDTLNAGYFMADADSVPIPALHVLDSTSARRDGPALGGASASYALSKCVFCASYALSKCVFCARVRAQP